VEREGEKDQETGGRDQAVAKTMSVDWR
jgi:hypothetical protein